MSIRGIIGMVLVLFLWSGVSAEVAMESSFLILPPKQPVEEPVLSDDLYQAVPVGFGPAASNGENMRLRVGLNQFNVPVDIYFLIMAPNLSSEFYLLRSDYTLQPLSSGIEPWKANTTGPVNETLFDVPLSSIPEEIYYFIVVVTPAGAFTSSTNIAQFRDSIAGELPPRQATLEPQQPGIVWWQAYENKRVAGYITVFWIPPEGCESLTPALGDDYTYLYFYIKNNQLIGSSWDMRIPVFDPDCLECQGIIPYEWKCWEDEDGYYIWSGNISFKNLKGHLISGGKEVYYVYDERHVFRTYYYSKEDGGIYLDNTIDTGWKSADWTLPLEDGACGDYLPGAMARHCLNLYRR